jgi:hypothetical protein
VSQRSRAGVQLARQLAASLRQPARMLLIFVVKLA